MSHHSVSYCPSDSAISSCCDLRSKSSTIATTRAFLRSSTLINPGVSSAKVQFRKRAPCSPSKLPVAPESDSAHDLKLNFSAPHRHRADEEPPISEVRIPLAAVVEQGLIELSKDDWRSLFLSTQKNLDRMKHHAFAAQEENRLLKRKLIEMQKCLFETRRNKHGSISGPFPWTIPDYPRANVPTPVHSSATEDDEEFSTGRRPSKVARQESETSLSAS